MLQNYLTTALRTLRRNRTYAVINVTGLAVGLATCILIGTWVQREMSYDEHFPDADHIHRLVSDVQTSEGQRRYAVAPPAWGPFLTKKLPEIETSTRFYLRDHDVSYGDASSGIVKGEGSNRDDGTALPGTRAEARILHADSTFLDVFGIYLERGNPRTALNNPHNVILSKRYAEEHFPNQDPVGMLFALGNRLEGFEVVGVMERLPETTHFSADVVIPFSDWRLQRRLQDWTGVDRTYTYLRLRSPDDARTLQRSINDALAQRLPPDEARQYTASLQPVPSIHLHSDREREIQAGGDVRYVWIFATVALLVLLVGCANYVNLATARAIERTREVAVRKALGAQRTQLTGQFLGESIVISLAAAVGAAVLAFAFTPVLQSISGVEGTTQVFLNHAGSYVAGLGFGALLIGAVSGIYPSLVLSRYSPARAHQRGNSTRSTGTLRRTLVVLQFAVAVALLIGTAVVWQQLAYLETKDLGFTQDGVVAMPADDQNLLGRREMLKTEMRKQPGVVDVATTSLLPGEDPPLRQFKRPGQSAPLDAASMYADPDLLNVLGFQMKAGRWFSRERASDSTGIVINETAAQNLGFDAPSDAVGATLVELASDDGRRTAMRGTVIGVVSNFHYRSLRRHVGPLVIRLPGEMWDLNHFVARVQSDDVAAGLAGLEQTWKGFTPYPEYYSSTFLSQQWEALYSNEQRMRTLFAVFAGLAIFVACLGLYGLAAFAANRRRQEIAIRKALGSNVRQIVGLLSKDFLKLVGLGFVLAVPAAWWGTTQWLSEFAYRIDVGPLVFIAAGLVAGTVVFVAMSGQAYHAARLDPTKVLQN